MSFNQITIVGNLGGDPELTQGREEKGDGVNFSVATNDGWGDNKKTNWHRVTIWGKKAGIIEKQFRKGDEIGIVGRVEYSESRDGDKYTNINANEFFFTKGSGDGGGLDDLRWRKLKPLQLLGMIEGRLLKS